MTYETLQVSITDHVCLVTINRPDKLNALNKNVFNDLDKVLDEIKEDANIKSAIITGSGAKAFVAGADISEFANLTKEDAMALSQRGQDVFFKIENSGKPIIAAVNGFALGGGCELAMACHFRLCSENAKFGQPEVNLGLIPGYGGTQRLTQLVGKGKSMELQMTGSLIDAPEALRLGLVNYVTPAEILLTKATELLQLIHTKAPVAVASVIKCINTAVVNEENKNGYLQEVEAFGKCFATEDMKEGTSAFLEKRKAVFTGK
ncbi:MAG: enoyl-CoA hydratase [Chitinophagaceae bacterium]|nr:MAG: enoyl-CoA hydratase [Chitinophagaceae bacterium]